MTTPFPIPVVSLIGPGSQVEDETLQYMPMPQGMDTFRLPVLPEPEELALHARAHQALRDTRAQLEFTAADGQNRCVDLKGLPDADLNLINQVLGEGEVSARVGEELFVQESVFAGIWRVVRSHEGRVVADHIELGRIPAALRETARRDAGPAAPAWQGSLPPNVQNAPSLLIEVEDQIQAWQPDHPAHVINLTLLPMSVEDIGFLDHHLGTGQVLILSRGYGNCRITNTLRPHCWRVVFYNSSDVVILNTVEISELPEVAQAAPEDLEDSLERLKEVLAWVEGV